MKIENYKMLFKTYQKLLSIDQQTIAEIIDEHNQIIFPLIKSQQYEVAAQIRHDFNIRLDIYLNRFYKEKELYDEEILNYVSDDNKWKIQN